VSKIEGSYTLYTIKKKKGEGNGRKNGWAKE
jgi:hypothetical protein